jgi:hypothetical protein
MAKNVKLVGFTATPVELEIIEEVRRRNYRLNNSEAIRMLINAGAEKVLGKKADQKTKKKA